MVAEKQADDETDTEDEAQPDTELLALEVDDTEWLDVPEIETELQLLSVVVAVPDDDEHSEAECDGVRVDDSEVLVDTDAEFEALGEDVVLPETLAEGERVGDDDTDFVVAAEIEGELVVDTVIDPLSEAEPDPETECDGDAEAEVERVAAVDTEVETVTDADADEDSDWSGENEGDADDV